MFHWDSFADNKSSQTFYIYKLETFNAALKCYGLCFMNSFEIRKIFSLFHQLTSIYFMSLSISGNCLSDWCCWWWSSRGSMFDWTEAMLLCVVRCWEWGTSRVQCPSLESIRQQMRICNRGYQSRAVSIMIWSLLHHLLSSYQCLQSVRMERQDIENFPFPEQYSSTDTRNWIKKWYSSILFVVYKIRSEIRSCGG